MNAFLTGVQLCISIPRNSLSSVRAEICLEDDLGQLKDRRVTVLPYNSSETTPIMLLESYAETAVTSSREGLWVLIPNFGTLDMAVFIIY
ncbi:hypothetical protein TNCV_1704471 [Trichonephila clavipes]|nr:hypothetical protein TNCV_1704471 [Trichonephila clavipes]